MLSRLSAIVSAQEEKMEIFDRSQHSSYRFLIWRINYPESFVINIRGNSLLLHLASYGHFEFKEHEKITFAPTRASFNKDEIEDWARDQSGKSYKVCSDCK